MRKLRDDEIGRAERKIDAFATVHGLPCGDIHSVRASDSAARRVREAGR